jgi:hypothetical protein
LLRDPYWPLEAARELGDLTSWPAQYLRAAPHGSREREPIVAGKNGDLEKRSHCHTWCMLPEIYRRAQENLPVARQAVLYF